VRASARRQETAASGRAGAVLPPEPRRKPWPGCSVTSLIDKRTASGAEQVTGPVRITHPFHPQCVSGMDDVNAQAYASRVLKRVRGGGAFPARQGETLMLAAHHEVPAQLEAIALTPPPAGGFPGATQFATSCTNKCTVGRPLGNASMNRIVIHDTEGGWNASVATLQHDPGKSVHHIIDADGSRVGQFRPETDTTWHAGNYFYNETSIGIEHVGVAADPAGYSSALYETAARW